MARKKCVICGNEFVTGEKTIPYKNREAHEGCFNNLMKLQLKNKKSEQLEKIENKRKATAKPRTKSEVKVPVSEEEHKNKLELLQYVKTLTGLEDLPTKVFVLLDKYINNYGFTYKGMYEAMYWYYTVNKNPPYKDSVGIIPNIYDEAKVYFESIKKTQEKNEKTEVIPQMRHVKIKPETTTIELINIDEIC